MIDPVIPIIGSHVSHELLHSDNFYEHPTLADGGAESKAPRRLVVSGEVVWVAGELDAEVGPRFTLVEHGAWLPVLVPESLRRPGPASGPHVGEFWTVTGVVACWGDRPVLLASEILPVATAVPPSGEGLAFDRFA
jgi:hypothetical protein